MRENDVVFINLTADIKLYTRTVSALCVSSTFHGFDLTDRIGQLSLAHLRVLARRFGASQTFNKVSAQNCAIGRQQISGFPLAEIIRYPDIGRAITLHNQIGSEPDKFT
ncbi:hypothetical protein PEL8287_03875 [Roseovarius litorisediminis]|uniref:Uncharacterized protein n=1 Tax=Roseovarius litorisediminis TaxID=1312363 RepID=A0A1Y5TVX6_9RHOB|nr:hypothetical protein PEL8287_03875 [Roseovarius litorisediminis]